jgi:succinate dehydrogenase/fumarate reductase flavoprotein subunit
MVAELLLDDQGGGSWARRWWIKRAGASPPCRAKAVVLATGGGGQLFAVNVFPPECTGDGYAMAYRAGAELVNLEFIQIGLCSMATGWPARAA